MTPTLPSRERKRSREETRDRRDHRDRRDKDHDRRDRRERSWDQHDHRDRDRSDRDRDRGDRDRGGDLRDKIDKRRLPGGGSSERAEARRGGPAAGGTGGGAARPSPKHSQKRPPAHRSVSRAAGAPGGVGTDTLEFPWVGDRALHLRVRECLSTNDGMLKFGNSW